jgi:hypothetical protein
MSEVLAVLLNGLCVSTGKVENTEMKVSVEAD